ncbi:MAG: OmpA family protein [Parasphingorhabdus sp.]|nr:OmpA family protein [Parasphingorhabdus sp.]
METGGKLLVGTMATVLLALVAHASTSKQFVDRLDNEVAATIGQTPGVTGKLDREPALRRQVTLNGEADPATKAKLLANVGAIQGIGGVKWAGDEPAVEDGAASAPENTAAADPATQAKIDSCQSGVDKSIEGKSIQFRSGSAYLSAESNKIIADVAAALKPCAGLSIAVEGHTDNNGNAEVNRILSQERADRVRGALIAKGISEQSVTAKGYGAAQPVAKGNDEAAAAQNRRIAFKVAAAGQANAGTGGVR